jgi:hypothetical protein
MIIKGIQSINKTFFETKNVNKNIGDQRTLRIGNIMSFISAVSTENIRADEMINFFCEIPEITNYAGVCFQQLFLTNIANLLAI